MDDVVLAAVCDIDLEKARSAAERHKAGAYYGDAAEMLAGERLDFVDIATTMESHASLVGLAASCKLPAIVQKPLAPTFEDCVAIVEETRAACIPFMVHENTRFLKPVRKVREIIDSGAIGKPTWARVSFRTGHDIYGKQPYLAKVENFVILDLGVHMLDVARFLMGEASRLYCQTQSIKPGIRGEDMATMLPQHESGATSVVEASYASPIHPDPFPQLRVQVEGTDNSIYPLTEQSAGTYVADTLTLSATTQYRLRITTSEGQQYLSSYVQYKPTPPIDSVSWTYSSSGVQLYVNTHDPANATRYYQWEYGETWEYNSAEESTVQYDADTSPVMVILRPETNQTTRACPVQSSVATTPTVLAAKTTPIDG